MSIGGIEKVVKKFQGSVTGKLGVGFKDLSTGEEYYLNRDSIFPSASTFKVFLLAEVMRQANAGKFKLTDKITLTDGMKSLGSGVLRYLSEGISLPIRDYAVLMMALSDNTATDILFDLVGRDNIKANILDAYGLSDTKCDLGCKGLLMNYFGAKDALDLMAKRLDDFRNTPCYTCTAPENDETSPSDAIKYLDLVYNNKLVNEEVCTEILDIMKVCQTNSRIPKFLPFVIVAHKTGTVDRVANDLGIVYTDKGAYALALYYNGNLADKKEYDANLKGPYSDDFLAAISKAIYDEYMK